MHAAGALIAHSIEGAECYANYDLDFLAAVRFEAGAFLAGLRFVVIVFVFALVSFGSAFSVVSSDADFSVVFLDADFFAAAFFAGGFLTVAFLATVLFVVVI
jgi:hypothetical protein